MTKKIKLGLSASVAFALMFATSVNVVAQEKINASDNNLGVKESVAANALAGIVHELNVQWAQDKAQSGPAEIEVMKEPAVKEVQTEAKHLDVTAKKLAAQWFEYTGPAKGTTGYDPLNPQYYTANGTTSPGCSGLNQVCAVHVDSQPDPEDPNKEIPDEDALMELEDDITNQIERPGVLEFKS